MASSHIAVGAPIALPSLDEATSLTCHLLEAMPNCASDRKRLGVSSEVCQPMRALIGDESRTWRNVLIHFALSRPG